MFWVNFSRSKLFSGGVAFEVEVPIEEHFVRPTDYLAHVFGGNIRLIIQIRLKYQDGFGYLDESDYAFRWNPGGWVSWPLWVNDDVQKRIDEEISRYPQHAD